MSVSHCIENYLCQAHVDYRLVQHNFTESAFDSARSAHVPSASVVKAVLLRDRGGDRYVMAIIPASHRLKMRWVIHELEGDMELADESDLASLFPDCELGAIPGFAQAYDMDLIWDDELAEQPVLHFEAGDHEELIRIEQAEFQLLFRHYPHAVISLPHASYSVFRVNESRGLH